MQEGKALLDAISEQRKPRWRDVMRRYDNNLALIARDLKVTRHAVWAWKRVTASKVLFVEGLSGISRYRLRPDIFGRFSVDNG